MQFLHRFHTIVFSVALVVYTITAFYSKGYDHYDEHYQLIEFARLKLGKNRPDELAWEYKAQIRAAFQPFVAFGVFSVLEAAGLRDPYVQALVLRLCTMMLSLVAIAAFVRASRRWAYPEYQRAYILLSYFLWFLPFLSVRFMSETWSGVLFLLACSVALQGRPAKRGSWLLVGLLSGFCVLCRYQADILIASLVAWLLIVGRIGFSAVLLLLAGMCVAVIAGGLIDAWFYNSWVITPWNYFYVNLVKGVASSFGTAPWYYYLEWLWVLPAGVLLVISLGIVVVRQPRQLVVWMVLPFFGIHSLIAHKEVRFLFPLAYFVPLLLIAGWQEVVGWLRVYKEDFWRPVVRILLGVLGLINLVGLVQQAGRPAGDGSKAITAYIHLRYSGQRVTLISMGDANPYNPLGFLDLPENFYRDSNVRQMGPEDLAVNEDTTIYGSRQTLWVIRKKDEEQPDFQQIKVRYHLQLVMQSIPPWSVWLTRWYDEQECDRLLLLYRPGDDATRTVGHRGESGKPVCGPGITGLEAGFGEPADRAGILLPDDVDSGIDVAGKGRGVGLKAGVDEEGSLGCEAGYGKRGGASGGGNADLGVAIEQEFEMAYGMRGLGDGLHERESGVLRLL